MKRVITVLGACVLASLTALIGCATSSESASRQTLTDHVGVYPAPPAGIERPRVGVPPFESTGHGSSAQLNDVAADQMTTLAVNSDRFDVIERAQLNQLLREQGLEGIVRPDELAQSGKVRGVDYLLIGKVSNLRVKAEKARRGFGLGSIPIPGAGNLGAFDFKRSDSTITAECGVDIRLVDATTGRIAAAKSSDYKRTDSIGAFGIQILGANADADADLQIDEDNKGLILRLALDQAFRDMLTNVDRMLVTRTREMKQAAGAGGAAAAAPGGTGTTGAGAGAPAPPPEGAPAGAKKFCSGCGGQLAAAAKFCGGCGAKVE